MIQANELRIGNWIIGCNGDYIKVDAYGIMTVSEREDRGMEACNKPVPLTNDILYKAGFENRRYSKGSYYMFCGQNGKRFALKNTRKNGLCYVYNHEFIPLKSLHTLQNFYFAITGEELDIKL